MSSPGLGVLGSTAAARWLTLFGMTRQHVTGSCSRRRKGKATAASTLIPPPLVTQPGFERRTCGIDKRSSVCGSNGRWWELQLASPVARRAPMKTLHSACGKPNAGSCLVIFRELRDAVAAVILRHARGTGSVVVVRNLCWPFQAWHARMVTKCRQQHADDACPGPHMSSFLTIKGVHYVCNTHGICLQSAPSPHHEGNRLDQKHLHHHKLQQQASG